MDAKAAARSRASPMVGPPAGWPSVAELVQTLRHRRSPSMCFALDAADRSTMVQETLFGVNESRRARERHLPSSCTVDGLQLVLAGAAACAGKPKHHPPTVLPSPGRVDLLASAAPGCLELSQIRVAP